MSKEYATCIKKCTVAAMSFYGPSICAQSVKGNSQREKKSKYSDKYQSEQLVLVKIQTWRIFL